MGLLRKGEGVVSPQNPRAAGRRSPPHTRHGWLMRSSFHTWLSHCPTRHRRLVPLPTKVPTTAFCTRSHQTSHCGGALWPQPLVLWDRRWLLGFLVKVAMRWRRGRHHHPLVSHGGNRRREERKKKGRSGVDRCVPPFFIFTLVVYMWDLFLLFFYFLMTRMPHQHTRTSQHAMSAKKKAFKTTKGVNLHRFLGDVLYPVLQLTDAIRRWARHKGLKIDLLRNLLEWTGEPDNDPRARLSRISDPRATFCYCCIAIGCIYPMVSRID